MKNKFLVLMVLSLGIIMAGCGYTTRSMISDKYKTIYIVPFANKVNITREEDTGSKYRIYRPALDTEITKAVSNKYLFDGNLRPTKEEFADLRLKGELVEYIKDALRYDNDDNVTEYRMNIRVNLELWDNKENKLLWKEDNFTGYTNYFTSGAQAKSDDTALTAALEDLSRRIVERTVEQW